MKSPAIRVILTLAMARLCQPEAAWAQYALSIDQNVVHVLDLRSHESLTRWPLNSSNPGFSCLHLTAAGSVRLFCAFGNQLSAIDNYTREVDELAALPPGDAYNGLAVDADGNLWAVAELSGQDRLLRLDPATGGMISSQPLSTAGMEPRALAISGDRFFVFTSLGFKPYLEEIDPSTGSSLSSVALQPHGFFSVRAAAFDPQGNLWVMGHTDNPVVLGMDCGQYFRIVLDPFTVTRGWHGCIRILRDPPLAGIAFAPQGTVLEIPLAGPTGLLSLAALIAAAGLVLLRRVL